MLSKEISSPTTLTTSGVARIFEVHPSTIRRWCKQGRLKSYRSGSQGSRRFLRMDVAVAYLDRSIQEYLRSSSACH
jgi:excisionase family DNA binding protein